MRRRAVLTAVVGGLLVVACARSDTLGVEEAVEVMVLDGVDRRLASCLVGALDGELPLDKLTGLDASLSDTELMVLASARSSCAPVVAIGGGVVGGDDPNSGYDPIAELADPQHRDPGTDIDELVDGLVLGGMDQGIGACLVETILADDDPGTIVASDEGLSLIILECHRAEAS